MNNSKPSKTVKCGSISAAIWLNKKVINGTMVDLPSITIDKTYKEGEQWKHTGSFTAEDLPKVALVAQEAFKDLTLKRNENNNDDRRQD
jgi:hypothetical protein